VLVFLCFSIFGLYRVEQLLPFLAPQATNAYTSLDKRRPAKEKDEGQIIEPGTVKAVEASEVGTAAGGAAVETAAAEDEAAGYAAVELNAISHGHSTPVHTDQVHEQVVNVCAQCFACVHEQVVNVCAQCFAFCTSKW
jgi:hypothetical protein